MSGHRSARVGRVARWVRNSTYALLGICAVTGIFWFVLLDAYQLPPPRLTFWWISHGVAGFICLLALGAALPHHVMATWRAHRNRWAGALSLAALALAAASALLLLYGAEGWHDTAHWCHVGIGLAALLCFPWHVVKGKSSVGRQ